MKIYHLKFRKLKQILADKSEIMTLLKAEDGFVEKCNDGVGARVLLENVLELLTLSHQSNRNTYRSFALFDFGMSLVFILFAFGPI